MRGTVDTGWRLAGLALAWVCGVALHLQQAALWPLGLCIAASALGALGLSVAWRWRRAFVVGLLGAALLACGASGWRASMVMADALPGSLEGQDIIVTGVIASLPQRSASGVRFRFEVEEAAFGGRAGPSPVRLPALLAVGWYAGFHEDAALSQPRGELRAGQRWRFTLRLRQPHGNLNPHGYDYELSLFEQGVRATGYVRDAPPAELLHRTAGFPVERLRQRVRDAIEASVPDRRAAGVLAALAVGDQGAIERDDWDLYRNTGIAHLVSISGLHITMFAWLAGIGIGALWRRNAWLMLWVPVPQAARWGGLICACAYALFSGWGVPSQRTVWMLATVTLLQSVGLRWPWTLVLLAAAVVVTALDPWALMQAGFWLSFVAVALLMASGSDPGGQGSGTDTGAKVDARVRADHGPPVGGAEASTGWRAAPRRLWAVVNDGVRTQVIATLGLTPLTLVFFQQVSIVGFAANLIAIPLITLVIIPLALLGVALVPLWAVGAWVVQQLNAVLGWLAALPGAVWSVPAAPVWAQWAGMVAAMMLVMPLPWRARVLAIPLALPLLMPPLDLPAEGRFDLMALDVGQGTSVLLRTHGHVLVYDAGPQYSRESDAGRRVLLPLLRGRGEGRIDLLVLSHRDLDHVGGAKAVLGATVVAELLSSLEADHPLLTLAPVHTRCTAGQTWVWDGVRFDMLGPDAADYERRLKPNAMTCVLRVSELRAGGHSVLLTGDIEREQEAALISIHGRGLRSDVLIVPHHGSKTSSTAAFLDAVRPGVAVFQAGYRNRFGHPAPDVLARYRERGIVVVTSPQCGAWQWYGSANGPTDGVCQRDARRRYWQHGAAEASPD